MPPTVVPPTVAITDLLPAHWHPIVAQAAPAGWTYELATDLTEARRMELVRQADVVFCGSATPTDEMLRAAQRLRFVQKLGAGYDNLNVDLCRSLDIGVARLAGNNAVAVAEHTLLLMLAVYRRLLACDERVRSGGWGKDVARAGNRELRAKTVGSIGLGQIGQQVAARLYAFEARVVYHDINRADPDLERRLHVSYRPLEDLLRESDIVSLHLPANPHTRHLINAERIAMMKPGAVLINCARGELVDEEALAASLANGHLGGAGLDCLEQERPGGAHRFLGLSNVVLTPHVAGVSVDNFVTMMSRAFANAQRFLAGEPLPLADVI